MTYAEQAGSQRSRDGFAHLAFQVRTNRNELAGVRAVPFRASQPQNILE